MASDLLDRRGDETGTRPVRSLPFAGVLGAIRRPLGFESRILLLALATGLPGTFFALLLVWLDPHSPKVRWTVTLLAVVLWGWLAANLRDRVVRPLQTLANLLSALREGDFSLRARQLQEDDALAQVIHEVNAIGGVLREQRLGAVEATALLHRVIDEVDVAVFAFDDLGRLRLVNRSGKRLLAEQESDRLLGRPAEELGLADLLNGKVERLQSRTFPSGPGRWEIRHGTFRERGLPHRLLVISDLSQTLREEERQAWQRLIRVLGHELNNSLAPIHSMASTLASLLTREPPPDDWKEDMQHGLEVIGNRSGALIRFMAAYARLARLPAPRRAPIELSSLIRRTAALETRLPVYVEQGPEVTIEADADQIEQLLINLIRNAVDAALLTGGGVGVGWRAGDSHVEVRVEDEGPGLSNTENLFVPFYTTKPGGTGIGLALSRQIAEAHGGTLTLENRIPEPGCEALLRLPL
ncbi:MAG TPA: ATP-binding protein [Thermoanaerobaculia bacterium]|jgi:nitrogen fixation/metabolism regulation signal transduction histidine kinase